MHALPPSPAAGRTPVWLSSEQAPSQVVVPGDSKVETLSPLPYVLIAKRPTNNMQDSACSYHRGDHSGEKEDTLSHSFCCRRCAIQNCLSDSSVCHPVLF